MQLLRRLNPHCAGALEAAADLCHSRLSGEIHIEHWLFKLIDSGDGDVPALLRHYRIDAVAISSALMTAIDRLPRGLRGKPALSLALTDLLADAWRIADSGTETTIRSWHLLASLAANPHRLGAPDAWPLLSLSERQIHRAAAEIAVHSVESGTTSDSPESPAGPSEAKALSRFAIDLTARAADGKIDPVFGRDIEIDRIIDVLGRRRKNNPILVGDPGVGKTALVEGLALRIHEGEVPDALRGVRLMTLDLGLLQAGAGVKGEFEQRLKDVIDEVREAIVPTLLFIDEAHTLIGAGNQVGSGDAANLLKPALARGDLRTIAATTWAEYKQFFERDAALDRRFQLIRIDEPDDTNACLMLRGIAGRYAAFHDVHIHDEAIVAAVRLSRRYIAGRQLPDKAIDLIDTAAARVRKGLDSLPAELRRLHAVIDALDTETARLDADIAHGMTPPPGRAAELREERDAAEATRDRVHAAYREQRDAATSFFALAAGVDVRRAEVHAARQRLIDAQGDDPLLRVDVDAGAVAAVVSDLTGVPSGRLVHNDLVGLLDMERLLGNRVLAQQGVLRALADGLRTARAGLSSPDAPLGVFLLAGPSGVGKTETARALADIIFGGDTSLVTINMSEYQEAHSVALLKGAPPGYVGYGQGGLLTEAIRKRPYCVLLLDEVEKAHRDVLDIFYQVFDRGSMRDGEGRDIDFRHCVILMTSNLGSEAIVSLCEASPACQDAELVQAIRPEITRHFGTALAARFKTLAYRPLDEGTMAAVADMELDKVAERLRTLYRAELQRGDEFSRRLAATAHDSDAGARYIKSLVQDRIVPPLADGILQRQVDGYAVSTIDIDIDEAGDMTIDFFGTVCDGGGD